MQSYMHSSLNYQSSSRPIHFCAISLSPITTPEQASLILVKKKKKQSQQQGNPIPVPHLHKKIYKNNYLCKQHMLYPSRHKLASTFPDKHPHTTGMNIDFCSFLGLWRSCFPLGSAQLAATSACSELQSFKLCPSL